MAGVEIAAVWQLVRVDRPAPALAFGAAAPAHTRTVSAASRHCRRT
jgi:hypothetical protein